MMTAKPLFNERKKSENGSQYVQAMPVYNYGWQISHKCLLYTPKCPSAEGYVGEIKRSEKHLT